MDENGTVIDNTPEIDIFDDQPTETTAAEEKRKYRVKVDKEELEVDEDELIKGYSRQADYTRKSQTLAEERKALEAQRAAKVELDKVYIETVAKAHTLKQKMDEYGYAEMTAADWRAEQQRDPDNYRLHRDNYELLQQELHTLETGLNQHQQTLSATQEQARQKALNELVEALPKEIPDWDKLRDDAFDTAVNTYGFEPSDLHSVSDVRMLKLLADATRWQQALKRHNAKNPGDTNVAPVVKAQGKTKTHGGKPDVDKMSNAEYAKWLKSSRK